MADQPLKRGFCPGVLRPMESGDGLIVRPRLARGRLAPARLAALAEAANRYGNGVIELTRRANLQLRGVSEGTLPDLQAELARLALAPASLDAERAPQVAVSALSELCTTEPAIEHIADAIERALATAPPPSSSSKLLVVVSGEHDTAAQLHADVRVELAPGGAAARLRVAGTAESALELGVYGAAAVAPSVARLLEALSSNERLRDVVAERGLDSLRALLPREAARVVSFAAPTASDCLGFHQRARSWLGLTAPLGWLRADDLAALARLAQHFGARELRLTPARELLVVDIDRQRARELEARLVPHGFTAARPLAGVTLSACSGAPACRSAHGETRALAAELGALVSSLATEPLSLHVSGCEKRCARSAAADVALVHTALGPRFDFGSGVPDALRARVIQHTAGAP
jgi:precorrin-3B synthase